MRQAARARPVLALAVVVGVLATLPLTGSAPTPQTQRLVAIGDVHGNHDALLTMLQRTGVASSDGRWTGGATTLVQIGDVLDRGPEVPETLDLLMSLEAQAPAAGGRVVVLLGNHEAMNLVGELRDVAPELFARFADEQSQERRDKAFEAHKKLVARHAGQFSEPPPAYREPDRDAWMAAHPPGYLEYREALGPGSRYGTWLRKRPAVVKVGDTVLVHGGIEPQLAPKRLEDVNRQVHREVETFDRIVKMMVARGLALPFFTLQELIDVARAHVLAVQASRRDETMVPSSALAPPDLMQLQELLRIGSWHLINPNSPLWFRGYATWTSDDEAAGLDAMLKRYGASRIVVGHTMLATFRITPRFDARVFLIDTGILSSYYTGGRASALEVRGSEVLAVYLDGTVALADPHRAPLQEVQE